MFVWFFFFFFNAPATTEIYTLSLHDALPISSGVSALICRMLPAANGGFQGYCVLVCRPVRDRKSTRLNSSHMSISYAVFCLKKKKKTITSRYQNSNRATRHSLSHSRLCTLVS